jgi:hypothetical protein
MNAANYLVRAAGPALSMNDTTARYTAATMTVSAIAMPVDPSTRTTSHFVPVNGEVCLLISPNWPVEAQKPSGQEGEK